MFKIRYKPEQLKKKIKHMEEVMGPRVNYHSDPYPCNTIDRWLLEYLYILKERYYKGKKKLAKKNSNERIRP